MNPWNRQTAEVQSQSTRAVDQGLRSYMLKVYNYMASGVLLTAIIAYFAGTSPAFYAAMLQQGANGQVGLTGLGWIVTLAPLAMVFFMMFKLRSMSTQTLQITFWAYAALMGLSMFAIFLVYTQASILRVFFATAATFGLLSIYGYSTKRDLTSIRSFLVVGIWAVLIVSLINVFLLKSSGLDFVLSLLGVGLALGFTAYDTQKLKEIYYQGGSNEAVVKHTAILGALNLYMDFVYLFMNLLRLLGDRR